MTVRQDPEALRAAAFRARGTARNTAETADALEITANLLDRLMAAEVDRVLAQSRLAAARRNGDAAELEAAEEAALCAEADIAVLEHALDDPLDLSRYSGCPAWQARIARPEVYRRVLASVGEGNAVNQLAYAAALAAARAAVELDCALIGDLETAGGL